MDHFKVDVKQPVRSFGTWIALSVVVSVNALFALNNVAPYLGLPNVGAMTMFSGLNETATNHFLMPKIPLGDADRYVLIVRARPADIDPLQAEQFRAFTRWASGDFVSLNLVRYQSSRVCLSSPRASLELTIRTESRRQLIFEDVCSEPSMLQAALLTGGADCKQPCRPLRTAIQNLTQDQ
jgi:hypothetical protein